jgi:hypothetical protein
MDKSGDEFDRLVRRNRELRAEAERLQLYIRDAASKAIEICVESQNICARLRASNAPPQGWPTSDRNGRRHIGVAGRHEFGIPTETPLPR